MARYEHERAAACGDPMPENLSLSEQKTYQAIRYLYAVYRAKRITQGEAAKEKAKILRQLKMEKDKEELMNKVQARSTEMWKAVESAASRYGTDRTLENADKLIETIYGVKLK